MNPGYAGRQELPENLKNQFRIVAMMVPDRKIIMRVKLLSSGFQDAERLHKKFLILYQLCEEQLSRAHHYDFGLRNILSVLRTLGSAKMRSSGVVEEEAGIMTRVCRDLNLSKLVDADRPLFLALLDDLFPGENFEGRPEPQLAEAIEQQIAHLGLVAVPAWVERVVQLYETAAVRHGFMVLGPTGSGKTAAIRVLLGALNSLAAGGMAIEDQEGDVEAALMHARMDKYREVRMNPKAITAPQMFGKLEVSTNDWTDGIFSALWRRACKKARTEQHTWIVLDGPVDAIWIENLNTVLDDNKKLTLANGDRLPMPDTVRLVFEVDSLENASPATVSRAGMICLSETTLGWLPYVESWLRSQSERVHDVVGSLVSLVIGPVMNYMTVDLVSVLDVCSVNRVMVATSLMDVLLPRVLKNLQHAGDAVRHAAMTRVFIFSVVWGVGGLLDREDRVKFSQFIISEFGSDLPLPRVFSDVADDNARMRSVGETLFDFFVSDEGSWVRWRELVPSYEYPRSGIVDFYSIFVPTMDNTRMQKLIDLLSTQGVPVLLTGCSGTAKTVSVQQYMGSMNPEEMLFKTINFSSATTPGTLQAALEDLLDKRIGSTFGPPAGKKMVMFLDDVSMPAINIWKDQVTNELVRQVVEQRGYFSLHKAWGVELDRGYAVHCCDAASWKRS